MHPVKLDQFIDCCMNGKGGAGLALVVTGIAMTVSHGDCNAGDCAGGSAPERKGILAGTGCRDVSSAGPVAAKGPAQGGFAGTVKMRGGMHVCF